MKNLRKILAVLVITITFLACSSGNKRNANFLPPLKIDIADEIKGDAELVDIIKTSEKAINEFSDNIEQIAIDGKDVLSIKEEDETLMDGLKKGKLMVQFVSNSTQMLASAEKFNAYVASKKSQGIINDTQLKALEQVATAFATRFEEINEKYKDDLEK